jgi:hypothetical protein
MSGRGGALARRIVLALLSVFFRGILFSSAIVMAALSSPPSLPLRTATRASITGNDANRDVETETMTSLSRRRMLAVSSAYATAATATALFTPSLPAMAFGFNDSDDRRRQVELCLVAILRVGYWAERQATALASKVSGERRKELYLESRLGAKAILTTKLGPGATGVVYALSTLNVPACLADLEWHAARELSPSAATVVVEAKRRFTEGLASLVEFDGLETLTDASPRSSLTLAQYTDGKAAYVERALRELVVPASQRLLRSFGPDPLARADRYVEQYYASERPPQPSTAAGIQYSTVTTAD